MSLTVKSLGLMHEVISRVGEFICKEYVRLWLRKSAIMIFYPESKNLEITTLALTCALLSIWNWPHTITLRYAIYGILFLIVILTLDYKEIINNNKLLLLFSIYLLFHLIFISNFSLAIKNFKSEWMYFLICSFIGYGVGLILFKKYSFIIFFIFGIFLGLPVIVHFLYIIKRLILEGFVAWGDRGINLTHGDLDYASLASVILLLVFIFFQNKNRMLAIASGGIIAIEFSSIIFLKSRGGLLFFVTSVISILALRFFLSNQGRQKFSSLLASMLLVATLSGGLVGIFLKSDSDRWVKMMDSASIGFDVDLFDYYCNGVVLSKKDSILNNSPSNIGISNYDVIEGDGSRLLALRMGLNLILRHWSGIDQSKEGFQIALKEYCKHEPTSLIAHTHNGWLDTAYSIGIFGALILFIIFLNYGYIGFSALSGAQFSRSLGLSLFVMSFIWILRSFLDSSLRDHMLEMQAFCFSFVAAMLYKSQSSITNCQSEL